MTITISEYEILNKPNHYELGEYIHNIYWEMKHNLKNGRPKEQNLMIHNCNICGEDTSKVGNMELIGHDHISCHIEGKPNLEDKDKCVICGKETPYLRSTNIYERVGYVEGSGQGCYEPHICGEI